MAASFSIRPGKPRPLGNSSGKAGTNFALYSANAESVDLCLFSEDGTQEIARLPLPGYTNGVWHGFVPEVTEGQLYGYRVHGPYQPEQGHRFNANKLLIDPYARNLAGDFVPDDALFGFERKNPAADLSFDTHDSAPFMPKCVVGTTPPARSAPAKPDVPWGDTILYETHVKGATQLNANVQKKLRGTFEGLAAPAMIAHFKKLGVTSIELMPVHAFFSEPRLTEMGLSNYWGYNSISFFAPHGTYMGPAGTTSFRKMVRTLHKAGIEVILDVVYNHTAESWELGPTLSMRGIDNASYYRLADDNARYYANDTGCGNSLNMDNPFVLKLVMDSLRFWVEVMEVDGFRFDLATTLARTSGEFSSKSGFLQTLQQDPVLAGVKLIAEPWDIGPGGYQLGSFPGCFAEWNDKYRDTVRRFWRGERFVLPALADALLGSASTFEHKSHQSFRSINFITSHDGFTLQDLISYNDRHNWANGEENRDGHGHNLSDNCGAEGKTDDPGVLARRAKRARNLLTTLMVSQGTPMLLAGDELGNSQHGNNNAYCQDNELSWLAWPASQAGGPEGDQETAQEDFLDDFLGQLIAFRKKHPVLSRPRFLHGQERSARGLKDVAWIAENGSELQSDEWHHEHRHAIGMLLCGEAGAPLDAEGAPVTDETLLIIFNNGFSDIDFRLPLDGDWTIVLNTAATDAFVTSDVRKSIAVSGESSVILQCDGTGISHARVADGIGELAAHYGVVDGFYDLSGKNHIAGQETKKALLEAMDIDLQTPADLTAALEQKHVEETAVLPPTMVMTRHGDMAMPVQLGASEAASSAEWSILLETGERLAGRSALVPAGTVHGKGGDAHRSYSCQLADDLPLGYHRFSLKSPVVADCHLIIP